MNDLLTVNGVAPGEALALRAFRNLTAIRRRAAGLLEPGLALLREFLAREHRLEAVIPPGGNVIFPRLRRGFDSLAVADRLRTRYSTLVVPGHFFESPRHLRLSFGCGPGPLKRGLRNLIRALDDMES